MTTAFRRTSAALQPSFPTFCPVTEAVEAMAAAGVEERGALFTRREVVDFILDLAGYTTDTAACTLASPREAKDTGVYADMSTLTSLRSFVTAFAGHVAAEAARLQS